MYLFAVKPSKISPCLCTLYIFKTPEGINAFGSFKFGFILAVF